ncbi:hypothetical protein AVEN_28011-1 [Araneus ventricosus]|uniref:Uncharacterized protein n=1 Tax=Araneus ventricosus TaxID=182803 RepID=A0A4Y2BFB5_ARAVE|nr:hypothetical protein AVEN_28011-1 [Araneus ventricosus]
MTISWIRQSESSGTEDISDQPGPSSSITQSSLEENIDEQIELRTEIVGGMKCFLTPKIMAVLDRFHISQRNAVFILEAVAESLGHNIDELAINQNTIQKYREDFLYVKSWLESSSAIGAPLNDLMFFKKLKKYENMNQGISSIALKKSCCLWYLNEESSIFDKNVNIASKKPTIENLKRENLHIERKCIVQPNEVPLLLDISPKPCKRLRYVGDFNEEVLESPTKAKLVVTVATEELKKKSKIIKTLLQKERRMQKRLKTFQEVIDYLKQKAFIPNHTQEVLEVCF